MFAETIVEELDFRLEAQNMVDIALDLEAAAVTDVVVPHPIPELVTERMLEMFKPSNKGGDKKKASGDEKKNTSRPQRYLRKHAGGNATADSPRAGFTMSFAPAWVRPQFLECRKSIFFRHVDIQQDQIWLDVIEYL